MNAKRLLQAAVAASAFTLAACEGPLDVPPLEGEQLGYRGVGMEEVRNPRMEELLKKVHDAPQAIYPPEPDDQGPMATEVYENVQVLTDLTAAQFDRLMAHITEWVAPPEQACNYCHNPENLADDSVYTKIVSRKMIQMTRHINGMWTDHVGQVGVTCYTCHRGNAVPYVEGTEQLAYWFIDPKQDDNSGALGYRANQNQAEQSVNYSSLPTDFYTAYLLDDQPIRIRGNTALPVNQVEPETKLTERVYALMIHMSQSMGVNCTYCHNSRAFGSWEQSTPQRANAWYGIRMVRGINQDYMVPLTDVFAQTDRANRLGPTGDVGKVSCLTCHQTIYKPLYGAPMLADHPELWGQGDYSQQPDTQTQAAAGTTESGQ